MLVRVTAEWCGFCKQMKQETYTNAAIIQDIDSGFVAIDLNADTNRELVEKMGVQTLPATLVISPDYRIVDREQGFRSASQLGAILQRHLRHAAAESLIQVASR
jgi:thioredoxin-like negative regulator of GroEL